MISSHRRACLVGRQASSLVSRSLAPAPRCPRKTVQGTSAAPAAPNGGASVSTSSGQVDAHTPLSPRKEAQLSLAQYQEIYDRLIKVFKERPRDDWKKLIVFSKQWPQHQKGVFDRIKELSDKSENPDEKMELRKIFRALQGVNKEVNRYNLVLKKIMEAAPDEWEAIVSTCRGDMQRGFFEHVQCLIAAAKDDEKQKEGLVAMNTRLVALVANFDSIEADQSKLEAAAEVYKDLLSSISSIEEADKKMAELAKEGKIDPAFLQITAKAYGAARDTEMTLEESKWVAYKLYRQARDYFDREKTPEKRIIEYLVTIRDPMERSRQLDDAVTPGPTRFTDTHDYMYSTPSRLYSVLHGTLQAYADMQAQAGKALGTSDESTTPRKIIAMKEIRDEIVRRYL